MDEEKDSVAIFARYLIKRSSSDEIDAIDSNKSY